MKILKGTTLAFLIQVLVLGLLTMGQAKAQIWYQNGLWWGTVCRNGPYYFIYHPSHAKPVGSSCMVRGHYGEPPLGGWITNE